MLAQVDCHVYNSIQHIDAHTGGVDESQLQTLAKILVKYNAHQHFSIRLLHRHREIAPNHAMVSKWIGKDLLQCTMGPSDQEDIYPCAFFVHGHKLVPYEYITEKTIMPGERLMRETVDFLEANDLDKVLAIGMALPSTTPWIENELPRSSGTVTRPANTTALMDVLNDASRMTNTEWLVQNDGHGIHLRRWRGCKADPDKSHGND